MKNFIIVILSTCFIGCSYISGPNGLFPDNSDDFFKEDLSEDLITDDNKISKDDHYPVFAAGEHQLDGFDSKALIKSFTKKETQKVEYIEDEVSFSKFLKTNCNRGDIFLTLGAGSITNWVNNLSFLSDENGRE